MQEGWITGGTLGKKLNITDRTVRNDIEDINYELKKNNCCHIHSVRGKGYQIAVNDRNKIFQLFDKDNINETTEGRVRNLAIRILFSNQPINLDDLEDQMFISRTRLEVVIKSINSRCKQKGLGNIVQHNKNSIFANCDEITRRTLIQDFIALDIGEAGDVLEDGYGFFSKKSMEDIGMCVHEILEEDAIDLTDIEITKITINLYIQRIRIASGKILKYMPSDYNKLKNEMANIISNKIADSMEKLFGMSYCIQERITIAVCVSGMRIIKADKLTKEKLIATIEPCYIVIVEELLNDIKNNFLLDLTQDENLFIDLVMHIRFSIGIKENDINNCNPILDTIKNRYPFIFELSTYIWHRFYDIFGFKLSEDQLSYIAVHLGAAIERLEGTKSSSNFSIAVCSNMSTGIVRLLMAKLYSLYMNSINIIGPYPIYNTKGMFKEHPSMVLTTTSASLFENATVPVISISPMLEAADILAINSMISKVKRDLVLFKLPDGIEKYFEEDLFFSQMNFNSQYEVLEFLSGKITEKGYVPDDFLTSTLEREKMAPTTFSNMIAMPHPIQICAYKTVIGVMTLNKPILWGNQNVRLIFMLAMRSSDMKYLNGFFDIIVDLVQKKKRVQKLIDTKDFTEFLKELCEFQ
jgi:lichenan operon transcriptional antiterminator